MHLKTTTLTTCWAKKAPCLYDLSLSGTVAPVALPQCNTAHEAQYPSKDGGKTEFRRHRIAASRPSHSINYVTTPSRHAGLLVMKPLSHLRIPSFGPLSPRRFGVRCQFKSTCTPHARRRPTGQILDRVGGKWPSDQTEPAKATHWKGAASRNP